MLVARCWPALLVPLTVLPAAGQRPTAAESDDCIPEIANSCFAEVAKDLACQIGLQSSSSKDCFDRDAKDMCFALDDALNCTSDIIDGDCSAADGRLVYDGWLQGLRSVQRHLCMNDATIMKELFQRTSCWDLRAYVQCLETSAGVTHVTDLLKVKLDVQECSRVLRAVASCSAGLPAPCSSVSRRLDAALTGFLLQSPCRAVIRSPCQPPTQTVQGHFSGATLAIVLLATFGLLLGGALLFFTHRTSCFRIPLARR